MHFRPSQLILQFSNPCSATQRHSLATVGLLTAKRCQVVSYHPPESSPPPSAELLRMMLIVKHASMHWAKVNYTGLRLAETYLTSST